MPTAGFIEAVDILEDGGFGLTTGLPCAPPDQFGLDRLEEGLNGGVEAPMFVKRLVRALSACTGQ